MGQSRPLQSTDDGASMGGNESSALAGPAGVAPIEYLELRIDRNGSLLRNGSVLSMYYRTDADGERIELDASPLNREDLDTLQLEVGIYQTSEAQATAELDEIAIQADRIDMSGFE